MWSTFFNDGGWGMYPTTIFGFVLIASAVLYLLRPERRWMPLVATLGVVTFAAGLLGTSVGFVTTFRAIHQVPPAEQFAIATLGCAESLNNLVLGLIIVVLAGLIVALAALRAGFAKSTDVRST